MTAIVGATLPLLLSPSSADSSAGSFPPNVVSHAPSQSSTLTASATVPESRRLCVRKAFAHRENGLFSYPASGELARDCEDSYSRQNLNGANSVLCRHHTKRNADAKTLAINSTRRCKISAFAHRSKRPSRNDFATSSRAPLLTENQQSRLQNEVTVFESITEPRRLGLDADRHNYQPALPEEAAVAFASVREPDPKLIPEELDHRQGGRKGLLVLSKLEEELFKLRTELKLTDQAREASSIVHATRPLKPSTRGAKEAQTSGDRFSPKGNGTQGSKVSGDSAEGPSILVRNNTNQGPFGEGKYSAFLAGTGLPTSHVQETLSVNKSYKENESEFTLFNLFSSSPSVPRHAGESYPSNIPISRNKMPLHRRPPTSIGSRSSPSLRSVNTDNSELGLQAIRSYRDASKVVNKGRQENSTFRTGDASNVKADVICMQTVSWNEAATFTDPDKNCKNLESRPAKSIPDNLDSGKEGLPLEAPIPTTENIFTHNEWMPRHRNPVAMPVQDFYNYDDSDRLDEIPDNLESYADVEASASAFGKNDSTVFPEHDADVFNQGNISELDIDKGPLPVPSAEHDMHDVLGSDDVNTKGAHMDFQSKSSKENKLLSQNAPSWQKHNFPELPFDFEYSYSESPHRPILGHREIPFSPFGPSSSRRPWIGGPPKKPGKKKQWVFDSFNPPPNNLKGVKHVEAPGPYPEGQSPKATKSREEIMGEPLTKEEIICLVEKCRRESRQLNLGRDGLTHNMLDLIHTHWKRRRVCRVKCKGVPTVDMENVKLHIEEKTGGKIIYQTGGVLYLFRGRNYNYKDRPFIPLMLWKPPAPIYPKLIQPAPEALTTEEAKRLRRLGRKVHPICQLNKNGFYSTLVEEVQDAFKVDDLVRIDCRGLNPSDYKKIGAKLRDLVPCVLLSFDKDHILMWKGKRNNLDCISQGPDTEGMADDTCIDTVGTNLNLIHNDQKVLMSPFVENPSEAEETSGLFQSQSTLSPEGEKSIGETYDSVSVELDSNESKYKNENDIAWSTEDALVDSSTSEGQVKVSNIELEYVVAIDALWEHAFQSGMAVELQDEDMDIDYIIRKADELAQSAPPAPDYTIKLMFKLQLKRHPDYKPSDNVVVNFGRVPMRKPKKQVKHKHQLPTVGVPGMGGLPVDELAKLLVK